MLLWRRFEFNKEFFMSDQLIINNEGTVVIYEVGTQGPPGPPGPVGTVGTLNVFTANQSVAPVVLSSGAVDAALSNNFRLLMQADGVLANPGNLTNGMVLNFCVEQDATGGRLLAYSSKYKFPAGAVPVLSVAAGAVDFMSCYYDAAADALLCNMSKGYA
jgi:hypothetical protein